MKALPADLEFDFLYGQLLLTPADVHVFADIGRNAGVRGGRGDPSCVYRLAQACLAGSDRYPVDVCGVHAWRFAVAVVQA